MKLRVPNRAILFRVFLFGLAITLLWHVASAWCSRQKIALNRVLPDKIFELPTMLAFFPDDPQVMAVVEKCGRIHWASLDQANHGGILLDLSKKVFCRDEEESLSSVAFDPGFSTNGFIYVFYSMQDPLRTRISRFHVGKGRVAEPGSELVLIEITKPEKWHKGGLLAFGPDGYLYGSIGESRIPGRENADNQLQSRKTLFGSIIRVDVRNATSKQPYAIPPDNPFVNEGGARGEIWAYGFRNPWRFSFHPQTGQVIVADVGGIHYEEINLVEKGKHYGWPIVEGRSCRYSTDHSRCDKSGKEMPTAVFSTDAMQAVIGGYIYEGNALADLRGKYVFAGFEKGLYAIDLDQWNLWGTSHAETLLQTPVRIGKTNLHMGFSAFAMDEQKELYVCDHIAGGVYRLSAMHSDLQLRDFLIKVTGGLWTPGSDDNRKAKRRGKKLYQKYGCASCHGPDGSEPTVSSYPKIRYQSSQYLLEQMLDIQSGARANRQAGLMRAVIESIDKEDLQYLAIYLSDE